MANHRFKRLLALSLLFTVSTGNLFQLPPADAGFLPNIGGIIGDTVKNEAYKQVGKMLAKNAPVYYNVKASFPKTKAPEEFNPQHLVIHSLDDLKRPLPPGDYWVDIVTYCSHVTIPHSGSNMAHTIAPAEGTRVQLFANLALRGEMAGVSRAKLQKIKWIIQTGLPLQQWLPEDRAVVEKLIPEFAGQLNGDPIETMKAEYDKLQKQFKLPLSFDDVLAKVPFGKEVIAMRNTRKVLTDQGISDRQVGGRLFAVNGDNATPPPPIKPEESPWYRLNNDQVIARAVVTHEVPVTGYSTTQELPGDATRGINRFEFRILPQAQAKGQEKGVKLAQIPPQVVLTLMEILYGAAEAGGAAETTIAAGTAGAEAAGAGGAEAASAAAGRRAIIATASIIGRGFILYGIDHAVQPLTITPAFNGGGGNDPDLCQKFKAGRAAYEAEVRGLEAVGKRLLAEGKSEEQVARILVEKRLQIGKEFKEKTAELGQGIVERIYGRNMQTYGNPYGPTYEWFKTLEGRNLSDSDIIAKASRPGGGDIIPQLLKEICGE